MPLRRVIAVVHGIGAVAELKQAWLWSSTPRWVGIPRHWCRGRIEALFRPSVSVKRRPVFHGIGAVAELKLPHRLDGGVRIDEVFHGIGAVAELIWSVWRRWADRGAKYSTALVPWPN